MDTSNVTAPDFGARPSRRQAEASTPTYFELMTASNFSLLRGASHPEELVGQGAAIGLAGLGLCDRNSLAGVVRGHLAARDVWKSNPAFRYLVGTRLVFSDGTPDIVTYPTNLAAYGRLCRLLTTGNRRTRKGDCLLLRRPRRLCRRATLRSSPGRRPPGGERALTQGSCRSCP